MGALHVFEAAARWRPSCGWTYCACRCDRRLKIRTLHGRQKVAADVKDASV
jgi:hypothetical protein